MKLTRYLMIKFLDARDSFHGHIIHERMLERIPAFDLSIYLFTGYLDGGPIKISYNDIIDSYEFFTLRTEGGLVDKQIFNPIADGLSVSLAYYALRGKTRKCFRILDRIKAPEVLRSRVRDILRNEVPLFTDLSLYYIGIHKWEIYKTLCGKPDVNLDGSNTYLEQADYSVAPECVDEDGILKNLGNPSVEDIMMN